MTSQDQGIEKKFEEHLEKWEREKIYVCCSRPCFIAGYSDGHKSRDKEVEELKEENRKLREALDWSTETLLEAFEDEQDSGAFKNSVSYRKEFNLNKVGGEWIKKRGQNEI